MRRAIERVTGEAERLQFAGRRAEAAAAEKGRLLRMAADFAAVARRLDGVRLREHLRPWLEDAVVDLAARRVVVAIRRVPAAGLLLVSSSGPGRVLQYQKCYEVNRVIRLPNMSRWCYRLQLGGLGIRLGSRKGLGAG